MSVPKTDALPLGYTPVFESLGIQMEENHKTFSCMGKEVCVSFPKGRSLGGLHREG